MNSLIGSFLRKIDTKHLKITCVNAIFRDFQRAEIRMSLGFSKRAVKEMYGYYFHTSRCS